MAVKKDVWIIRFIILQFFNEDTLVGINAFNCLSSSQRLSISDQLTCSDVMPIYFRSKHFATVTFPDPMHPSNKNNVTLRHDYFLISNAVVNCRRSDCTTLLYVFPFFGICFYTLNLALSSAL